MKKILTFISVFILTASLLAQVPNKMSFQTVVRNNLGKLVVNKSIGVRLSILKTSSTGTAVYVEAHTKTSNVNGLVTLEVGKGIVSSGTFSTIDWAQGPYFMKTEMDVNGGENYTISSVTEFVSVPYAKSAENVKTLSSGTNVGEMNYWDGTKWMSLNIGEEGQTLTFCDGKPTWTVGGVCIGAVTTLNCASVTHNGTINALSPISYGLTSLIPYSGGNGGAQSGQYINSTGVKGLYASLQPCTIANGNGVFTLYINGTPASSGTAYFELTIGGKTCTLSRVVNASIQQPTIGSFGANITDIEGNVYKTVNIGKQQWMAENLKVSKYNDGVPIPVVTDNEAWRSLNTGAWCYYNNDAAYNGKYGKLYNWYAMNTTTNGNKNVCPIGWHVPTDDEWTILTDFLGSDLYAASKMKEVGTANWLNSNSDATNSSLFTGLPGGFRYYDGFYNIGSNGFWWSSTEYSYSFALNRYMYGDYTNIIESYNNKYRGLSVRCLKD